MNELRIAGFALLVAIVLAAVPTVVRGAGGGENGSKAARHAVVFEVTMEGEEQWTAVLNNVENLRKALGTDETKIEVVGHSNGLGLMLARSDGARIERMKKLAEGGVVFAACENTMRRKNVTRKDLLPFVVTVDSGVAEVVRKQEAGSTYLKSGI